MLRRHGLPDKGQAQHTSHWPLHHDGWLALTIAGVSGSLKVNLELLLRQLKGLDDILAEYGQPIEVMARLPRYEKAVHALTCDQGIKPIFGSYRI